MSNLVSISQKHAKISPNKIAYTFLENGLNEKSAITYSELDKKTRAIAAHLQSLGLSNERVLLIFPPGIEFVCGFMACLYAGVIAVPLALPKIGDLTKTKAYLNKIVKDAGSSVILTVTDELKSLNPYFQDVSEVNNEILIIDILPLKSDNSSNYQSIKITKDAIAYLQYTSGSTSQSKGVIITHGQLTSALKANEKIWHYSNKSITLNWAPHTHVYGLICGLLLPLHHGTHSYILATVTFVKNPFCWLEAITKYKVTHSGCPNFGYELCINAIPKNEIAKLDLSSWKVAICGGEKVQYRTLKKFFEKFSAQGFNVNAFCGAYGSSELTGTITATTYLKAPKTIEFKNHSLNQKLVSCGKFIPGLHGMIIDPNTLYPVKKGEVGELWLRGKTVANGYWNNSYASKQSFNHKIKGKSKLYFRTGDLGCIRNKEFYITGRLKDLIIVNGKKYYPTDLEDSINALENLNLYGLARVVFSINKDDSEKLIFLQEITNTYSLADQTKAQEVITQTLSKEHGITIHDLVFVTETSLPKTQSGKIQRNKCKQNYLDDLLSKVYKVNSNLSEQPSSDKQPDIPSEVQNKFIKLLGKSLSFLDKDINLSAPLSQFNFDSISIVRLSSEINSAFKVTINPAEIYEFQTGLALLKDIINKCEKVREIRNSTIDSLKQKVSKPSTDIAIIGISGVFPGANNVEEFWDNLVTEKDVITEIPKDRWDWQVYDEKSSVKWGGFVDKVAYFDANFFSISPREAELIDPQQRLFAQVVWNTLEDAGYSATELDNYKTGLFVGVFNHDYAEIVKKSSVSDAYITTGITGSILANRISFLFNFRGPSEVIDTACSSSLVALHHAVNSIHNGECDLAVVGGANLILTPSAHLSATKAGMLSPDGHCKTFDAAANGYVRSEGVVAVLIKSLDQAVKDYDHIYGIIKGTAVNHGGHVNSLTAPNPKAQAEVILSACAKANVNMHDLTFIEMHGTGTSLGDPIEIHGLKKAFQMAQSLQTKNYGTPFCGLGALKSNIGHLEAAAGLAGVIKVLLAMHHEKIPGNLHLKQLNPYIDLAMSPFYIVNKTQGWLRATDPIGNKSCYLAGVSSFGFGGTNAHIILQEAPKSVVALDDQPPFFIPLSAKTDSALYNRVKSLHAWLNNQKLLPNINDLSYTLAVGRSHFKHRYLLRVDSTQDLIKKLVKSLQNTLQNIKEHPALQLNDTVIDSFSPKEESHLEIAKHYLSGEEVEWKKLYRQDANRISLPTYPFDLEYYWLDISRDSNEENYEIKDNEKLFLMLKKDLSKIIETLLKIPSHKILDTIPLSDLGFDSISFKEFSSDLEIKFGITFNPSQFFTYKTLATLNQHLWQTYPKQIAQHFKIEKTPAKPLPIRLPVNVSNKVRVASAAEDVAVIGMHGYFPQSKDLEEFWEHLEKQDDLVSEIPSERWNWQEYYGDAKQNPFKTDSKWVGHLNDIDKFDADFFNISSHEAKFMDPQQRLLLEVVWKSIEDAGIDPNSLSGKSVGVFAGVEFNDYQILMQKHSKSYHGHMATGTSPALIANRISYYFNFTGPSEVISTACSSSLVAIHNARHAILRGECEIAIACGVSLMLNPETLIITSQLRALSPDGRCKTFDKSANGYVKGEGVAAILLSNTPRALQEGYFIYGLLKSSAVNHGGKAQSLTAPNAETQGQLIFKAYTQANIDPTTVSYIETHGTGTELGDPIEIEGLKIGFADLYNHFNYTTIPEPHCGLGSLKTNIGHLEPASGIASFIKVMLAFQKNKLPGLVHFNELNPYITLESSPFYLVEKTQNWIRLKNNTGEEMPHRAGISSFGFGGTCAHLVVEEYYQPNPTTQESHLKPYYLITLSAKTEVSLKQKINDLIHYLKKLPSTVNLESLSYSLNARKPHFEKRLALIADSADGLLASLEDLNANFDSDKQAYSHTDTTPKLGSLFKEIYSSTLKSLKDYQAISGADYREKLSILADLYCQNYPMDWEELHFSENKKFMTRLPTYPFAKVRHWYDDQTMNPPTSQELLEPVKFAHGLHSFVLTYLKNIFAEKINKPSNAILENVTYEIYGIDSLLAIEITNRLEIDFPKIPKTILYEKNTLNALSLYLENKYKTNLNILYPYSIDNLPIVSDKKIDFRQIHSNQQSVKFASLPEKDRAIAIIGISGIFPQANDLDALWENLMNSRDCITEIPKERWDYRDYTVRVGGEEKEFKYGGFIADIEMFDPLFFGIAPKEAMLMDPQERLILQNTWTTLENAGYTRERLAQLSQNAVGVFIGATYNFYPLHIAEEWQKDNRLPLDIQMFSIANRVSYFLNINGPSYVVDTACSSSLSAIHLACESLLRGECSMAIAGGVNLSLHPAKYHFLGGYNFLSDKCATFSEGGSGYVPAEGVGSVLLKYLIDAIADGDQIYGVIQASQMNHGGKTSGYTVPNPTAQAQLIKSALEKAKINPRSISYIEAHGTGTALGDPIEVRGLQEAFEEFTEDKQFCAIGSIKSNIGHMEAAAGISQLAKVLLQMQHKTLVPSIHAEKLNPFIDFVNSPFYVQDKVTPWESVGSRRRAGISSFGAGGTNVHLVVEEYLTDDDSIFQELPNILIISAHNKDRLMQYVALYVTFFEKNNSLLFSEKEKKVWLARVCYTSQTGREAFPARLSVIADNLDAMMDKLKTVVNHPANPQSKIWINMHSENKSVHSSLINRYIQERNYPELSSIWTAGAKIEWDKLYTRKLIPITIPTYPFAKRRCWVGDKFKESKEIAPQVSGPCQELDFQEWLYKLDWKNKNLTIADDKNIKKGHWLIFNDKELGFSLQNRLGLENCIHCFFEEKYEKINNNSYYINPQHFSDYVKLISEISKTSTVDLQGILYLGSLDKSTEVTQWGGELLYLFQALLKKTWKNKLVFCLVTRGSQSFKQSEPISVEQYSIASIVRIFAAENANYETLLIDFPQDKKLVQEAKIIIDEIKNFHPEENQVIYRDDERYLIKLTSTVKESSPPKSEWVAPLAVIITGGLGALGSEVAKWLVGQGTRYFLLMGVKELPNKEVWSQMEDAVWQDKFQTLRFLEQQGATVHYSTANITKVKVLRQVVQQQELLWKNSITGVFHLAGVTTDNVPIEKMNDALLQNVFSAKVYGALTLHELFNTKALDCFVLFSSISALPFFGMSGLSAYAMANAFLDGLALQRRAQGLRGLSINWAAWADKGMSHRYNHSTFLEAVGMSTISLQNGIKILHYLLANNAENTIVFKIDWDKFLQVNTIAKRLPFFSEFCTTSQPQCTTQAYTVEEINHLVITSLADLLHLDIQEINQESTYSDYGLDSIIGINFVAGLNLHFANLISPMDLYKYPTVNALVSYISHSLARLNTSNLTPKAIDLTQDKKIEELSDDEINSLLEKELYEIDQLI